MDEKVVNEIFDSITNQSINSTENDTVDAHTRNVSFIRNSISDCAIRIPFWLVIEVQDDSMNLILHHSRNLPRAKDRIDILANLRIVLNKVRFIVNQRILLQQLHETKWCSPLLVAGNIDKENSDLGPNDWPNKYACDIKYEKRLILHDRILSSKVKNSDFFFLQ